MKRIYFSLLPILFYWSVNAQRTDSLLNRTPLQVYQGRQTTYKTAGFLMLGTGLLSAGYAFYEWGIKNGYNGTWELESLFLAGAGLAVASVPMFILSGHNKRKAALVLKSETLPPATGLLRTHYPAMAIRIPLNFSR